MKIAITTNTDTAIVIECVGSDGDSLGLWVRAGYERRNGGVYVDKFGEFPLDAASTRALAAKLNEWAGRMDRQEAAK